MEYGHKSIEFYVVNNVKKVFLSSFSSLQIGANLELLNKFLIGIKL